MSQMNNATRIAFDAKRAMHNTTGLGNYSRYVIEALSTYAPELTLDLYAAQKGENDRAKKVLELNGVNLVLPTESTNAALWRTWGITDQLKKSDASIYHGLSNELPLNIRSAENVKSVVTIHDLIFCTMPHTYTFFDRHSYNYKYGKSCRNADHIIAVSECTKRDIVNYWGINPDKISVIYQGCDPAFARPVDEESKKSVKEKYNLPDNFILNVGSIEERKNALLAVKAIADLPEDIHLVIVGRQTAYTTLIKDFANTYNLSDRLHILSNVDFNDLLSIYRLARTFVYPSRYEGFGIPIVEALSAGLPVVAAMGSCLEEAGGPDQFYVNADDNEGLARAIERTFDPMTREYMVSKGQEHIKKFSMQQMARQTVELYNKLLNE